MRLELSESEQRLLDQLHQLQRVTRRWMAARPVDPNGLAALLADRERDLELAATIGQSLLEQNRELNTRNEYLEERLANSSDTVVQLQHELKTHIDLLRVYSHYDDDLPDISPTDNSTLRSRIERLNDENAKLKNEAANIRSAASESIEAERAHAEDLAKQLDSANGRIHQLQTTMGAKSEECQAQREAVERLLEQISRYHGRHNEVVGDNENLQRQLEEAMGRQECLLKDMCGLQEQYTELRGLFSAAEEELMRFRQAPPRSHSVDSLYDSLASELENSDSGFSSTPAVSARHKSLHLELAGLELSPVSEVSKPTSTPLVLQCPQSPVSSRPPLLHSITCDASTSTAALEEENVTAVPTTSTPKDSKERPPLQFSDTHSTQSSPSTPFRPLGLAAIAAKRNASLAAAASDRTPSDESLNNYVAPKMGEPGVPGTRDLDFSLKRIQARRQVERDFARFLRQKGLPPTSFFSSSRQSSRVDEPSVDWSIGFGLEHHRMTGCTAGLAPLGNGIGVVTRAELGSPHTSPQHRVSVSPLFASGLATLSAADLSSGVGGIVRRVL